MIIRIIIIRIIIKSIWNYTFIHIPSENLKVTHFLIIYNANVCFFKFCVLLYHEKQIKMVYYFEYLGISFHNKRTFTECRKYVAN